MIQSTTRLSRDSHTIKSQQSTTDMIKPISFSWLKRTISSLEQLEAQFGVVKIVWNGQEQFDPDYAFDPTISNGYQQYF